MSMILTKIGDSLRLLLGAAIAVLLALIIFFVFVQVVTRYITHSSTYEIAELSRLLFIWVIFLGAALLVSHRSLILIDIAHGHLGKRQARAMQLVKDFLTAVFLVAVAVYAYQLIGVIGDKIAPATGLPFRLFYLPPIVFSIFSLLFLVEGLVTRRLPTLTEPSLDTIILANGDQ